MPHQQPTATLKLDINFDAIKDRAQFFEEVQSDLSHAANLRPEQVRILDLRAGSTVVDFSVPNVAGRNAGDILQDLKKQLKQPGSALMRGKHTRRSMEMTVHQAQPAPLAPGHSAHGDHQIRSHAPHIEMPSGGDGSHGYRFDVAVCREMFKDFEGDKSGRLKINAMTRLSEKLWDVFHPNGPKLDLDDKEVELLYFAQVFLSKCSQKTSLLWFRFVV